MTDWRFLWEMVVPCLVPADAYPLLWVSRRVASLVRRPLTKQALARIAWAVQQYGFPHPHTFLVRQQSFLSGNVVWQALALTRPLSVRHARPHFADDTDQGYIAWRTEPCWGHRLCARLELFCRPEELRAVVLQLCQAGFALIDGILELNRYTGQVAEFQWVPPARDSINFLRRTTLADDTLLFWVKKNLVTAFPHVPWLEWIQGQILRTGNAHSSTPRLVLVVRHNGSASAVNPPGFCNFELPGADTPFDGWTLYAAAPTDFMRRSTRTLRATDLDADTQNVRRKRWERLGLHVRPPKRLRSTSEGGV